MKTTVEKHFDKVAGNYDSGKRRYSYYYESLKKLLRGVIPKGKKVFEVGCGTGDLLASLNSKTGYGMDISETMIKLSKSKYKFEKNLTFSTTWPSDNFDYIFMSDVIEHLEKPRVEFQKVFELMDKKSRFVITMANPIWEPLLMIWEKLGWKMPEGRHMRIGFKDIKMLGDKVGMKIVKHDYCLLIPVKILFLTNFINKYLEVYLKKFAFIEYFEFKIR